MADLGIDVIVTSGGLGPTADDLTAEVVGAFQGREMVLDEELSGRIAKIVAPLLRRWPNIDPEAIAEANRKQATIPRGATVLEPVGTAPGLVVTPGREPTGPAARGPTIVVLPGPPRELQPMWGYAVRTDALRAALADARVYRQHTLRLFGIPESEIAETLRIAEREGVRLDRLEVTTCLKRGEVEVVTRYEPDAQVVYDAFVRVVETRHADTLFSTDGATVDEQVAVLLRGDGAHPLRTIATAESCTGGLLAARLTELAGASDYCQGRDRRVLERGEGVPGGRLARADRALRSRLGGGRPGAGRRRTRALWRRTSAWGSPVSPVRVVAPSRSPWGWYG